MIWGIFGRLGAAFGAVSSTIRFTSSFPAFLTRQLRVQVRAVTSRPRISQPASFLVAPDSSHRFRPPSLVVRASDPGGTPSDTSPIGPNAGAEILSHRSCPLRY